VTTKQAGMEYRTLGPAGIDVSVVGFGCGGNARLMIGDDDELRLRTVRAALDAGVTYFDTAAVYGQGRSERNLGRTLRALGATPVVSTKVALQDADRADLRGAVLREVDGSLERLGARSVDILMLHNRVFDRPRDRHAIGVGLTAGEVLGPVAAAFRELLDAGRVRAVGFTGYGGDPGAQRALLESGLFGVLSVSYNALNPSAVVPAGGTGLPDLPDLPDYAGIARAAAAAGLGVVAMQVLGRGVLGDPAAAPDPHARAVAAELGRADPHLPRAALRYVLAQPLVTTSLLGFSAPEHVADAADAVRLGPLPAQACRAVEAA
jgi:aryl-alcohol dehydrogenase-like predicted oxidoreductase